MLCSAFLCCPSQVSSRGCGQGEEAKTDSAAGSSIGPTNRSTTRIHNLACTVGGE